jgi:hypothetical protein
MLALGCVCVAGDDVALPRGWKTVLQLVQPAGFLYVCLFTHAATDPHSHPSHCRLHSNTLRKMARRRRQMRRALG